MKAEIKKLWTDALRSGEYKQGYGMLRSKEDEFCCLGVLCELAVKAGVIPPAEQSPYHDRYQYQDASTGLEDMVLTWPVCEWAGLMEPPSEDGEGTYPIVDPIVNYNDTGRGLADVNDECIWLTPEGEPVDDDYHTLDGAELHTLRPNDFNIIADLIDAQL